MSTAPYAYHTPIRSFALIEYPPTSLSNGDNTLITQTCRVMEMELVNRSNVGGTGSVITVSVRDGNNVYWLPPTPLAPGGSASVGSLRIGRYMVTHLIVNISAVGIDASVRAKIGG